MKAKKYLEASQASIEFIDLMTNPPTKEAFLEWSSQFDLPLALFFNTRGTAFKQLGLKEQLPQLSNDALASLLASDGYLIKRPLLITSKGIGIGFQEAVYQELVRSTPC